MSIDKLTSGFDFEKFKKDCILHSIVKSYIDTQLIPFSCDEMTSDNLRKELEKNSVVLGWSLKHAKCFPSLCESCVGLEKCINCLIKENCVDALIQLSGSLQCTAA
jgi:hypothetical protein